MCVIFHTMVSRTTQELWEHMANNVLIPSDNRRGSKTKKELSREISGQNRQSSSWARILLLLMLTHSLTQTDSIVAYAFLGSKLQ